MEKLEDCLLGGDVVWVRGFYVGFEVEEEQVCGLGWGALGLDYLLGCCEVLGALLQSAQIHQHSTQLQIQLSHPNLRYIPIHFNPNINGRPDIALGLAILAIAHKNKPHKLKKHDNNTRKLPKIINSTSHRLLQTLIKLLLTKLRITFNQ